jgi:hypothetical protein
MSTGPGPGEGGGADEDDDRTIESPPSAESIYLARGSETDPYRPVCTGDVFQATAAGLDVRHEFVMVLSHPCSMRAGALLRPLIQVTPVVRHGSLRAGDWRRHFRLMLLPELLMDGSGYAASFELSTPMRSGQLLPEDRVACLSEYGILVLFQRHVRHLTRFELGIRNLEPVARAVLTEVELQEDWNRTLARARVDAGEELHTVLESEAQRFDDFLGAPDSGGESLRDALNEPYRHPEVRRAVALEIQRRSP